MKIFFLCLAVVSAGTTNMFSYCVPATGSTSTKTGATNIYSVKAGEMCQVEFPIGPQTQIVHKTNVSLQYDPNSALMVIEYRCPPFESCYNKVLQWNSSFTLT